VHGLVRQPARAFALLAKRMRAAGESKCDKAEDEDDSLHVDGLPMELIELDSRGTRLRQRRNAAAGRSLRYVHARNDGELRIGRQKHHDEHQYSLRHDGVPAHARFQHEAEEEKEHAADQPHVMQMAKRAADDESGAMNAFSGVEEERRQRAEGNRSNLHKEQQRAQPETERKK
jgi:hypothetical protein